MTSAEFAAKYRVLKSLTEHGARSQIAQELALGRMVMVHHLDVGSAKDRQRLLANVAALEPSAAAKVLEVADVEGTNVVVTQFLATFTDFPTWVKEHVLTSGDAATVLMQAASPSTLRKPVPPAAPGNQTPGSFTETFGAVKPATPPTLASAPPASLAPVLPLPPPPEKPIGSFTQVFGATASPPLTPASSTPFTPRTPSPLPPPAPGVPRYDAVMPPVQPYQPPPPAPAPAPPPPTPLGAGSGFTDLFSRLETPVSKPTPAWQPPPTPIAQPVAPPSAAPSEFTRVLGSMSAPPAPQLPQAQLPPAPPAGTTPTPAPVPGASPPTEQPPKRSMLPVIIALNVVVVLAIVIVLLIVVKR